MHIIKTSYDERKLELQEMIKTEIIHVKTFFVWWNFIKFSLLIWYEKIITKKIFSSYYLHRSTAIVE